MGRGICLLAIGILGTLCVAAADDAQPLTGGVEVGYRNVNVDGNEDKYREDVNLADNAFRLFSLDLAWRPEKDGALDQLTLDARNLGNEPYSWARLNARKVGRWDFTARYSRSEYFYQDAGYFFRVGGDYHTWDANRTSYGFDFRVKATDWLTLRAGADRMERSGSSQTTRDVQRNLFQLGQPLDQNATEYWIGADFRAGWADITVEQRLASYENQWLLTAQNAEGYDPSDNSPGGATLDAYQQLQTQNSDTPISRVSFAGHPNEWFAFSAGYLRASSDLDYSVDGDWSGLDYDDSPTGNPPEPYATTLSNGGSVERTSEIWNAEVSVRVDPRLEVAVTGASRSYEQSGTIDWQETQTGGKEDGTSTVQGELDNDLQLDDVGLTVRWGFLRSVTLSVGFGFQRRQADLALAGPEVTTERTLYRVGLRYQPGRALDARVDYEQGRDDGPYTQVSPTDTDRLRANVRWRPTGTLRLDLHYKDETSDNDLNYPLGRATDDTPPVTQIGYASFDFKSWGVSCGYQPAKRWNLDAGYDHTEIDSDADIVYVTGYTFVPAFDVFTMFGRTGYESRQDAFRGLLQVELGHGWTLGATASLVRNDGTFPLDWTRYGADGRYSFDMGLYVRLAYDYYELSEDNPYAGAPANPTPHVNDYQANLLTASLGYRF